MFGLMCLSHVFACDDVQHASCVWFDTLCMGELYMGELYMGELCMGVMYMRVMMYNMRHVLGLICLSHVYE